MEKILVVYYNQNSNSFGNYILYINSEENYIKTIPELIIDNFKDINNKYKPFYNAVLINYFKL